MLRTPAPLTGDVRAFYLDIIALLLLATIGVWGVIHFLGNRGSLGFSLKATGALLDLGIEPAKFHPTLNKMFIDGCLEEVEKNGRVANPHEFALSFFLLAVTKYPGYIEHAMMSDGFMIDSIHVSRSWQGVKVRHSATEDFVLNLKRYLIEAVQDFPMDEVERLAKEIQILEL